MKRHWIFLLESELLHWQVKGIMFSAKYLSLQFNGEPVNSRTKELEPRKAAFSAESGRICSASGETQAHTTYSSRSLSGAFFASESKG